MSNMLSAQEKYYVFSDNASVFTSKKNILNQIKKLKYFELNANSRNKSLEGTYNPDFENPEWYEFLMKNKSKDRVFLIINFNNTPLEKQKKFNGLIKDRIFQTFVIPDNCKIVVTCKDKKNVLNELFAAMIEV